MSEQLITVANKNAIMDQVIESITEPANTTFYLFAGKSTQYEGGDSNVEVPADDEDFMDRVYSEMLFGKRVTGDDVLKVIPRNDWETNTVFTQYDDTDPDILSSNFHVVVDDGALFHVYKCLYNNMGSASTVKPSFAAVSSNDSFYETSDGYHWKYMYTVEDFDVRKFATTDYFPVIANTEVADSAVTGAIETYEVSSGGSGYDNYLAGNNVFGANDRALGGNTLVFDISSNSSSSASNNFYNGCYIYIKDGNNNEAGQYRRIADYTVNSTSKAIILETAFSNTIGIGATYDIYPGLTVLGDGSETVTAEARAIVNASSNSIVSIEVLSVGSGYRTATATVDVADELTVEEATIRPIKSPWFGHGFDPAEELGSTGLCISVDFANTESNTILGENDYRTIGLLRDPTFANVVVTSSDIAGGGFVLGETVHQIRPIRLGTNATVNTTSSTMTDPDGDFENQFVGGDSLYLLYSTSATDTHSMLTTVSSVTNSTSIELATNATFSALTGGAWYFIPRDNDVGMVTSANSSSITLDLVSAEVEEGDMLIGGTSGALATAEGIFRSGVQKDFSTFINADKYVGTQTFGTFVEDETVTQVSSNTYATFHSVVGNTDFYTTGGYGTFDVSNSSITGQQSGAIATLTAHHGPELDYRSGDIVYVENLDPVSRAPTQSETFKLIFKF